MWLSTYIIGFHLKLWLLGVIYNIISFGNSLDRIFKKKSLMALHHLSRNCGADRYRVFAKLGAYSVLHKWLWLHELGLCWKQIFFFDAQRIPVDN